MPSNYISGNFFNYEARLHQLAQSSGDLSEFYTEYQDYAPNEKFRRELIHKYYSLAGLTELPTS